MVTRKSIFLLWLPLAAMWLMMGVEQPAIAAAIARLPNATEELAAFGLSFSIALLIESPVLQLLTTGTALAVDREHYRYLLRFATILSLVLVAVHIAVGFTPLYAFLARSVIGVPESIVEPGRRAFVFMIPFTPAVAYRRLWQGVLIRNHRTRVIPVTMVARIVAVAIVLTYGLIARNVSGAALGGFALSAGVVASAAAAYCFVRPVIRRQERADASPTTLGDRPVDLWGLVRFYLPLALTSLIALGGKPLLTVGIARAPAALESLAVWPVITGFLFLFTSITISYQEVVVALAGGAREQRELKSFARLLALGASSAFLVVGLSPIGALWYRHVAGLPPELLEITRAPMIILGAAPAAVTLSSWLRGLAVHRRKTVIVTKGAAVNLAVMITTVFFCALFLPVPGAVSGTIAYVTALIVEVVFLSVFSPRPTGDRV